MNPRPVHLLSLRELREEAAIQEGYEPHFAMPQDRGEIPDPENPNLMWDAECNEVPNWPEDLSAAWALLESLPSELRIALLRGAGMGHRWICDLFWEKTGDRAASVIGATAPEAILRAFVEFKRKVPAERENQLEAANENHTRTDCD